MRVVFRGLRAHALRTALTTLGIVIGVAAVITMVALAAGARERVAEQIESMGANVVLVWAKAAVVGGARLGAGSQPTLTEADAWAIQRDARDGDGTLQNIMQNIMLVSVRERTREIGLRIAVGARGRDILAQFLVEALAALSILGGLIGVGVGVGAAYTLSYLATCRALLELHMVLAAVAIAAALGIPFGIYPAHRAARLQPDRRTSVRVTRRFPATERLLSRSRLVRPPGFPLPAPESPLPDRPQSSQEP